MRNSIAATHIALKIVFVNKKRQEKTEIRSLEDNEEAEALN